MVLLVDENAPKSVAEFFEERGHDVLLVSENLPAGTPDPVVAAVGNRLSAVVVSWDKDFKNLARRVPTGTRQRFRRLGRITFRCNETQGRRLLEKWIDEIERYYERCLEESDFRMIVEILQSGLKLM